MNKQKYGLRDALARAHYKILYNVLSGLISTLTFKLKGFVFGVSVGERVKCFGPVHLIRAPGSRISISNNVTFISRSARATASSLNSPCKLRTHMKTAAIEINDGAGLNGTSITARSKTITIGAGTMLGPNVIVIDSDFHQPWPPNERLTNPGVELDESVSIGKNVWVGLNSVILKGVTVGDNSVIGAGSIVVNDIPENSLAAGNPAKVIKNYVGEMK